jgi:hypothetical protein
MEFADIISVIDFIWLFFFLLITIFFSLTFKGKWISKQILLAFLLLKIASGIAMTIDATKFSGDVVGYHLNGLVAADKFIQLITGESLDYIFTTPFYGLDGSSTARMVSLTGFLLAISGKSFFFCSFVFSIFGGIGHLLLFRNFALLFPQLKISNFYPILFHLSLVAWTSHLTKDGLGILALGLSCFYIKSFLDNYRILDLILFALGVYIAILFRSFINLLVVIYLFSAIWSRFFEPSVRKINKLTLPALLFILTSLILVISITVFYLQTEGESMAEMQQKSIRDYSTLEGGSNFENAALDYSLQGSLAVPIGTLNALVRPYIWEAGNFLQLLAAVENLFVMSFLFRSLFVYFFRTSKINKSKLSFFIFNMSVVVFVGAAGVGLYSSNSGTISRYRVPVIPFLMVIPCVIFGLRELNSKANAPLTRGPKSLLVREDRTPSPMVP